MMVYFTDIAVCKSDLCSNGGLCVESEHAAGFTCVCEFGFKGTYCEEGMLIQMHLL